MHSEVFGILMGCHFPYGVLGQVWYLIASIPDLCLLSYFFYKSMYYYICPGRLFYILANSEDPGQMPHAAFYLGRHCLPKYLFTGIQNDEMLT